MNKIVVVLTAIECAVLIFAVACNAVERTEVPAGGESKDELPDLAPVTLVRSDKLKVVATTSIVGDVVKQVGGSRIDLTVLMPVGSDPHSFDPTPQDIAAVSDAHVVFANGLGLEPFLDALLDNAGAKGRTVYVSLGVRLRGLGDVHAEEGDHEHENDPHTWTDPANVSVWTDNIEVALGALDPEGVEVYAANANGYRSALQDLDHWIEEQVSQIPRAERKLVTDHDTFGYFADRYGFEIVGAVIPGYSTLSAPSAQQLADLQDAIRALGVKAVFVGETVNPVLARRVAEDVGVKLAPLYTGSLSVQDGPASSYRDMMRYNVTQIVDALE
jgi:ABC-type Zn uptake system ZnuABC Zn-binding protein ZnuA